MRLRSTLFTSLLLSFITSSLSAQLPPPPPGSIFPKLPPSAAGCSITEVSACEQAAAKILPVVLGPSPLEENLRRLTDEIGGRVSGSPQMAKAVEWGKAAFRAAGVDVHTEKFTLPNVWSEGETRLEIIGGAAGFPVHLVSLGMSPPTPAPSGSGLAGGIEARLIYIGEGSEADFARAGAVKDAILLVNSRIGATWDDLFEEYTRPPEIISRAIKGGAAAILWTAARERMLLYRHNNEIDGRLERIPGAIVAREDALRLARLSANGNLRVRLSINNHVGGPVEQENVIGEIRGREKPEEVVILAAHLDSWELGTGALDNGCNAALVIEAARAIKASGLVPRRTIRFILFGGEEQDVVGSAAYVKAHSAEMDKIRGVIVYDAGSGRTTGFSLGGRRDIEPGVREALKPLDSWGATQDTYDMQWGTDHFDFMLEGVPTLVANQEVANYLVNYHAASDTFDKVDLRELKLNTALAAVAAWGIADRATPIGKRLSHAEISATFEESGFTPQMKTRGYWEAWQSGARGRKP
ncbi:MAG: M20/M25/M40 family metallo-hydrolase [Acidobacteriia bacterium]|nr:M20/M25/M40 family metallo-hydrolase [Terriglobia bacterium]